MTDLDFASKREGVAASVVAETPRWIEELSAISAQLMAEQRKTLALCNPDSSEKVPGNLPSLKDAGSSQENDQLPKSFQSIADKVLDPSWLAERAREIFAGSKLLQTTLQDGGAAEKFMLSCRSSFHALYEVSAKACQEVLLEHLEKAHFDYFVEFSDPKTGLTRDRSTENSSCSIAGVGFSLSAHLAAAERGWISREAAADYTLKVLKTLWDAPQGETATGASGYKGFFYHFIDPKTSLRAGSAELSTVDTALLMAGVLSTAEYFKGDTEKENEIRSLATKLYERVDWKWAMRGNDHMSMGWDPEAGFIDHEWKGYNEAMLLMVLAMASPTHPISPKSWKAYSDSYKVEHVKGQPYIGFGPMFGHQYSHAWIDFAGIRDDTNRKMGFDYFENSRRAVQAQVDYAARNPNGWKGYDSLNWGITASDGPGLVKKFYQDKPIQFHGYTARGPGGFDDGTLAPTAVAASIPFAPELTIPTLALWRFTKPEIWSPYGFKDAFNPSFDTTKPSGWVAPDTLAIDQGPVVMMIENQRSGLYWKLMKNSKPISDGLRKAGFQGGWLDARETPAKDKKEAAALQPR